MQVFDTHAHLLSDAFDDDREQVIARIQAAGVCLCMEAGTTLEDSAQAVAQAEQYGFYTRQQAFILMRRRMRLRMCWSGLQCCCAIQNVRLWVKLGWITTMIFHREMSKSVFCRAVGSCNSAG